MNLRLAACAAMLTLIPTAALASDWVEVSVSDAGDITYVDRSSISRSGPIIRYWQRREISSADPERKETISLRENNCATGQTRVLQLTTYTRNGKNITSSDPGLWDYVTPDTVGMTAHKFLCGG